MLFSLSIQVINIVSTDLCAAKTTSISVYYEWAMDKYSLLLREKETNTYILCIYTLYMCVYVLCVVKYLN